MEGTSTATVEFRGLNLKREMISESESRSQNLVPAYILARSQIHEANNLSLWQT